MEMPMLPDWPAAFRVGMIKVLGVASRVRGLPVRVMAPLGDGRVPSQDLADDGAGAHGEVAPAFADYRCRQSHPLDFGPTHPQAFLTVPLRQAKTPCERKA